MREVGGMVTKRLDLLFSITGSSSLFKRGQMENWELATFFQNALYCRFVLIKYITFNWCIVHMKQAIGSAISLN